MFITNFPYFKAAQPCKRFKVNDIFEQVKLDQDRKHAERDDKAMIEPLLRRN